MIKRIQHHQPSVAGIRWVALFEASKGVVVILAGLGFFSLINHNLQDAAEQLAAQLHFNPSMHLTRIFIEAASNLNDARLALLALASLLYSTMRFIEAYGLWHERRWAEWFAVISGGVYLPVEIVELVRGVSWIKLSVLAINLVIVIYMASVLAHQKAFHRKKNESA